MKHNLWIGLLACLLVAVSLGGFSQQSEGTNPEIDPQVKDIMRKMSERIKLVQHFRFQIIDTIDEVQENGQKLQFFHMRTGTVSRPNKLRIDTVGDINNRSVWKDEKTFTLLDKDHNVYVQLEFTGTIDELMDMALERYGVSTPLADLLSADMREVLMKQVQTGEYIGLHHVGELKCHHLAFTQENIDWQVWIAAGDEPQLRKMLITYKQLPGEPQYTMTVWSIEHLTQAPPPETFQFKAPEGATKIEFMPRKGDQPSAAPEAR